MNNFRRDGLVFKKLLADPLGSRCISLQRGGTIETCDVKKIGFVKVAEKLLKIESLLELWEKSKSLK